MLDVTIRKSKGIDGLVSDYNPKQPEEVREVVTTVDNPFPELFKQYANFLDDPDHLIAVTSSANRSKGSKAPHEWMPKNKKYWKTYIKQWCAIKIKWRLTVSKEEIKFMQQVMGYEIIQYPIIRYDTY